MIYFHLIYHTQWISDQNNHPKARYHSTDTAIQQWQLVPRVFSRLYTRAKTLFLTKICLHARLLRHPSMIALLYIPFGHYSYRLLTRPQTFNKLLPTGSNHGDAISSYAPGLGPCHDRSTVSTIERVTRYRPQASCLPACLPCLLARR